MTDTTGVNETLDDALRVALTIASQFAERISRLREQFAHQWEAATLQEYLELEARFEAERGATRARPRSAGTITTTSLAPDASPAAVSLPGPGDGRSRRARPAVGYWAVVILGE
ncbi:hypothetical protein QT381_02050 [Galbitalea sp. SE-J8]|uniref:hypothetical protein n=1 Tax=Galbitalea sp. SE-J8 TaxID=3054952 RepID=UPI00259D1010|nr:hypothetical protein [Galbitalea sp. SE-J8]MDM4761786.1 hypothetical protein [Galbitalea sp. SE-J8]